MTQNPDLAPRPRTPEELTAIRRRSMPAAIAGAALGIVGLAMMLSRQVGARVPPNILGANLSFCAIMMGAGILFYAKGAPGTRAARIICLLAIAVGLAGPVVFAMQSVTWRQGMEARETENAAAIAQAAQKFAADNDGRYPNDFSELVTSSHLTRQYIDPQHLLSPFGGKGSDDVGNLKLPLDAPNRPAMLAEHSDYTYTGAGLKLPLANDVAAKIIVVYETDPVMRSQWAMGFADGTAKLVDMEEGRAMVQAGNEARKQIGLKEMEEPQSVLRAQQVEK